MKNPRARREDCERKLPGEERRKVLRDACLEGAGIRRCMRVERDLSAENRFRHRPEHREGESLLEKLVQRRFAELAHGAVHCGRDPDDRHDPFDGPHDLGEHEGHRMRREVQGARGKRPRVRFLRRHDQRLAVADTREVDRERVVGPGREKTRGLVRSPAQERDPACLERVVRQGGDESDLVILRGEDPARATALVEQMDSGSGEGALREDGAHVPSEQRRRFDECDTDAGCGRTFRHAAAPFGRPRKSPAKRASGAEAAYVTSRPARAYWRSHQMRARIAAKRRK